MRMGIIGAGSIASIMAPTIARMDKVECYAIAARDESRAQAFAKEFGFEKAYGSYEELVMDPYVELVYVATPHSHHYEHVKLCLENGKHVLCEKAFTRNAKEAEEILTIAEKKRLLLTEAIWTRYMPMRKTLDEVVESGIIGEVTSLYGSLGYPLAGVKRMREPELAGGALLDLGVYPINFASMVFGTQVEKVHGAAVLTDKGVDALNQITLIYRDGRTAMLHSNMTAVTDRRGFIYGSDGYIEVKNINNCEGILIFDKKYRLITEYKTPRQISGYEYEVEACIEAIENGWSECPAMPHKETLRIMKLMDDLRADWGVKFPGETV